MAIEFFDGFDTGRLPEWFNGSFTIDGNGRNGSCLFSTAGLETGDSTSVLTLSASQKKIVGMAYKTTGGFDLAAQYPISFVSGSTRHITINFDATGHIIIRRGDGAGTVLATSTEVYPTNVWRYIEASAIIDDAAGSVVVKVDGVQWVSYIGGDTRNGGTTTDIDKIYIGFRWPVFVNTWVDDLYVLDGTDATATTGRADNDFLGDVKVATIVPNGEGDAKDWTGTDADKDQNHLLIDEISPNTSDYIKSSVANERDLWTLTDVAAPAEIYGIRTNIYAQKSDAGDASFRILTKGSTGTTINGAAETLSTTWTWYRTPMMTTKPDGGGWTVAELNALQVGVERL